MPAKAGLAAELEAWAALVRTFGLEDRTCFMVYQAAYREECDAELCRSHAGIQRIRSAGLGRRRGTSILFRGVHEGRKKNEVRELEESL